MRDANTLIGKGIEGIFEMEAPNAKFELWNISLVRNQLDFGIFSYLYPSSLPFTRTKRHLTRDFCFVFWENYLNLKFQWFLLLSV